MINLYMLFTLLLYINHKHVIQIDVFYDPNQTKAKRSLVL